MQVYETESYNYVDNASTSADGNYTVSGLPAGSYLVGYFPLEQPEQYYRQHPTIWDATPVTVTAGGDHKGRRSALRHRHDQRPDRQRRR